MIRETYKNQYISSSEVSIIQNKLRGILWNLVMEPLNNRVIKALDNSSYGRLYEINNDNYLDDLKVINQPIAWEINASTDDNKLNNLFTGIYNNLEVKGLEATPENLSRALYERNNAIEDYDNLIKGAWSNGMAQDFVLMGEIQGKNIDLGNYFSSEPGCAANVCYHNAVALQGMVALAGTESDVLSFNFDINGNESGHAVLKWYNEDEDEWFISDPTEGVNMSVNDYVEHLYDDLEVKNIRNITQETIFKLNKN